MHLPHSLLSLSLLPLALSCVAVIAAQEEEEAVREQLVARGGAGGSREQQVGRALTRAVKGTRVFDCHTCVAHPALLALPCPVPLGSRHMALTVTTVVARSGAGCQVRRWVQQYNAVLDLEHWICECL